MYGLNVVTCVHEAILEIVVFIFSLKSTAEFKKGSTNQSKIDFSKDMQKKQELQRAVLIFNSSESCVSYDAIKCQFLLDLQCMFNIKPHLQFVAS